MASPKERALDDPLVTGILDTLTKLAGDHPGYRPVHAKGVICTGQFTPAPGAATLTRAPHAAASSTPVIVRFSNAAGMPGGADNDPTAGPRGIAIRFSLGPHKHTDIIAHSFDGFPVRTGEEFLELFRAIAASGPDAPKPPPVRGLLGAAPH